MKYIQVLADGEKASSSDIDLSNYIKIKDFYVDVYENPYYGRPDYDYLSDEEKEEIDSLSPFEQLLFSWKSYQYYYKSKDFNPDYWSSSLRLNDGTEISSEFQYNEDFDDYHYYFTSSFLSDDTYFIMVEDYQSYISSDAFYTNARVHFIKHF